MLRYWHTLLDNLVFLTCLMPLVGAALVAVSARLGVDAVRRTALTNALLTLLLTLLMAVHFDPRVGTTANGPIQMSSSWQWLQSEEFHIERRTGEDGTSNEVLVSQLRGPNVRIAVGVDGISLWFVVLTALLTVPAMLAARQYDRHGPSLCYAMLLLLQAALMGAFAALDVVFFLICLEMVAFPLLWLIGRFGGYGRIVVARWFFVRHLAGTLLVACGLLATVAAHARMNLDPAMTNSDMSFNVRQLIFGGQIEGDSQRVPGLRELMLQSEEALEYWSDAGAWIFLALFAGFALLAAIVPCHSGLTHIGAETPTCAGLLLLGMVPALGAYGFARFVVPLFPPVYLPIVDWISTLGILGAIHAGLLALTQHDVQKLAAFAGVSQICLAVAGIFSFHPAGMAGGIVLVASAGLSKGALLLLRDVTGEQLPGEVRQPDGFQSGPTSRLRLFSQLAVIGVPGFGSFVGQFLVLQGLFDGGVNRPGSPLTAAGGLIAIGLVTWSVVRFFQLPLKPGIASFTAPKASTEQQLAVAICLVVALWIGIVPATFIGPMEQSVIESVTGRPLPSTMPDAE